MAGIKPSTFLNKLIVHPVAPIVGQLVAFSKFDRELCLLVGLVLLVELSICATYSIFYDMLFNSFQIHYDIKQ